MSIKRGGLTAGTILAVLLASAILIEIVVIIAMAASGSAVLPFGRRVALIRIEGVITDSRPTLEYLDRYQEMDNVSAIVIRIESPGGSVAAVQEIAAKIREMRGEGKVFVASVANIGASGGYYIASQCDRIVVNPGSLVGSIGVIMQFANAEELYDWIGVNFYSITSGEFKEIGTSTREMTPEERELLQGLIDEVYGQFVDDVLIGRSDDIAAANGISPEDTAAVRESLLSVADGRVFSGSGAIRLGLADRAGGTEDAVDLAGELAGIEGEPNLLEEDLEEKYGLMERLLGMAESMTDVSAAPPPGLFYLYAE